ncbi:MAG: altronate dehydratase [Lachnospiraceae bacterium]|nr:altronate dehydratase [Lachnospiraceae bacterium]
MSETIQIHEKDNVAVALQPVDGKEPVEPGHKIALQDIRKGDPVIKYGYPIGIATEEIPAGSHVHTHNMRTCLGPDQAYTYHPAKPWQEVSVPENLRTFMGYERKDGRIGIRNELWIIPTVGCVNGNAKAIATACAGLAGEKIDAVIAFSHPYGCSQMGDDQEYTREILADLIRHPNAGGVLVLGLGCENSNIGVLKGYLGEYDEERIRFLSCQDVEDEMEEGCRILNELAALCREDKRSVQPVSKLMIGLKCGGSDGLSGITANPVTGVFSDLMVSAGGSTILTEVPEMFGAETILMDRAADRETFDKIVSMISDFKEYFRSNGEVISENPSPGNKAGGISTLEDKALGCTQKSGSAPVVDVLRYAQQAGTRKGLHLLEAPGNDLVASTALAAAGAQLILFTTGRGTPFACPVPTLKISTNSTLARRKSGWIDFDCGRLLTDGITKEALAKELFERVLAVAGGDHVKSEQAGYADLAIWKQGVTL